MAEEGLACESGFWIWRPRPASATLATSYSLARCLDRLIPGSDPRNGRYFGPQVCHCTNSHVLPATMLRRSTKLSGPNGNFKAPSSIPEGPSTQDLETPKGVYRYEYIGIKKGLYGDYMGLYGLRSQKP